MIECSEFFAGLRQNSIEFFAGVPDSLLKNICAYITDTAPAGSHVITSNEGAAVALASGHYLATSSPGLVYMQNSGIGNAVNPLLSLTDEKVYSIPLLLLIGWRGEPGVKDEPQHIKQGEVTLDLLESMGIPYKVIDDSTGDIVGVIGEAAEFMKKNSRPYALVVRKGTFSAYSLKKNETVTAAMEREEAIGLVAGTLPGNSVIVSTTGKISRELYEYRDRNGLPHSCDFLTVGSMGHSSQIALGIAKGRTQIPVYCFDGDGAVLMHMGSLAVNGFSNCKNFRHIIFNNAAHDSVGGQPTLGGVVDLSAVASACGYKHMYSVSTKDDLKDVLHRFSSDEGPSFLEIKVRKGARKELGRPKTSPVETKENFMNFIMEQSS